MEEIRSTDLSAEDFLNEKKENMIQALLIYMTIVKRLLKYKSIKRKTLAFASKWDVQHRQRCLSKKWIE